MDDSLASRSLGSSQLRLDALAASDPSLPGRVDGFAFSLNATQDRLNKVVNTHTAQAEVSP